MFYLVLVCFVDVGTKGDSNGQHKLEHHTIGLESNGIQGTAVVL